MNYTFYITNGQNAKTYSLRKHFIEFLMMNMPHFAWIWQHLPLKVQGSLPAVGITHNDEYVFLAKVIVNNTLIYGYIRKNVSCEYFNISGYFNCLEEAEILLNEGEI